MHNIFRFLFVWPHSRIVSLWVFEHSSCENLAIVLEFFGVAIRLLVNNFSGPIYYRKGHHWQDILVHSSSLKHPMVLGIVAFNCYRRDNHFKDKFKEIRGYIYFSKTLPRKNKGGCYRNLIWAYEVIISCDIAWLFINGMWQFDILGSFVIYMHFP